MSATSVKMIRPHLRDIPEEPFPPGWGMRPMTVQDIGLWTDIQIDAEPFITIKPELFMQQFGSDLEAVPQRCFLLIDPRGLGMGTISAWYNRDFQGADYGRIHWVSVRPCCQGKGLGKAQLAYAMQVLTQWHDKAYLVTSTERAGAVAMYLNFGFTPDLDSDEARARWAALAKTLKHPRLEKALRI
jgi:GNAT superfamily N-acetyltransferase